VAGPDRPLLALLGLKGKMKMLNAIRRKDRELNQTETEKILVEGTYGVLSMNGENDYAYGVPLSYVYTGNGIYLHCAAEGRKITRIRNDNRVSFCVVGEAVPLVDQFSMKYESAIVFGKAYEVDREEKLKALILLVEKYSTGEYLEKGKEYALNSLHRTAVIRIDIELISGKARR
jgi:nitroimidazol reductase NimA-like FMN-containing flavoprotein (pyridoxamine 5'-phosphate oxidase superfamily)